MTKQTIGSIVAELETLKVSSDIEIRHLTDKLRYSEEAKTSAQSEAKAYKNELEHARALAAKSIEYQNEVARLRGMIEGFERMGAIPPQGADINAKVSIHPKPYDHYKDGLR